MSASDLAARIERSWTEGGAMQWALRPLGLLHAVLVGARRRLYRHGLLATQHLSVRVIVVGNRVAGGAGKTPTTLAIVAALQAAGWTPGIVSRGHGGSARAPMAVGVETDAREVGDEPVLMQRRSGVPVWVGRDRVAAAQGLLNANPAVDVLVCDDGLQHLRLARTVEVVVFDERGAGNGWLLPAGPLREAIDAPSTAARSIVLYNAARPSTPLSGHCAQRGLTGLVSLDGWWRGETAQPIGPDLASSWPQRTLASAGIGQPQRFFDALGALDLAITPWPLPDHHDFLRLPWPADARAVIVTEKDAVKLRPERLRAERPGLAVWVAPLAFTLPPAFIAELLGALSRTDSR